MVSTPYCVNSGEGDNESALAKGLVWCGLRHALFVPCILGVGPDAREDFEDGGGEDGLFEEWVRKRRGEGENDTN